MKIRIVTDSAAHLSPHLVTELGITVVPCHVRIGNRDYLEGVDLDDQQFYHRVYDQGMPATTLPPSAEEFHQVYRTLTQSTGEIVSLHLSGALSDTVKNATQAANMLLGCCQIVVLDSQTVSMGLDILVEAAARAAAEGQSLDDVVRLIRGLIPQIYVVFFSENLEYLERGGRIGHAQALLGTMLGIKPFLTLEGGEILPMEKVKTRDEAIEKLLGFVSEFDAVKQIAVVRGYSSHPQEVEMLMERLSAFFPDLEIPMVYYGPVLAAHVGPDTLGVVVYEEPRFEE